MNIIYIGCFPPSFLVRRTNGRIDSLYRDAEPLIKGLSNHTEVELSVITSPDVASWPKGPLFIHRELNSDEKVTLVSSLNISVIKQPWTIISMAVEVGRLLRKCQNKVAVIIPYIVFRHVVTLRLLHLLFPKKVVQICVVPDVFFPKKRMKRMINKLTEKMASKFDGCLLYTEKMAEHLHVKKGNYVVIEGYREVPNRKPEKTGDFRVVYAGSLNLNYGLGRLVEAMGLINDPEIQLHLYGGGSAEGYVKDKVLQDNRIVYHGRVSNAEATDAIYRASVLVNPRNANDGEYTEYSFPSKDIEYMSTGVPTLLCKLPGMPPEYYGHFIDIEDGAPSQIADAIMRVKNMTQEEREEMGQDSRNFIIERMDCDKQAERIVGLIDSIMVMKNNSK